MADTVLVTGGFGLVGSATVRQLAADGRRVVIADLETPANAKKAKALPQGVEVRWADLTDADQVQRLVSDVAPVAIIHLAAIIAPAIYRKPKVARRVNVEATATLVRVAEAQPTPPRFVHASSNAVFGPRNPHRTPEPLTRGRPDAAVRRLQRHEGGGRGDCAVVEAGLGGAAVRRRAQHRFVGAAARARDAMFFESALPSDNRVQTVDVRDVAWACAAATTADVVGEILLIAGDESHRRCYGDLTPALVSALGMPGAVPPGRPGNPDSDTTGS